MVSRRVRLGERARLRFRISDGAADIESAGRLPSSVLRVAAVAHQRRSRPSFLSSGEILLLVLLLLVVVVSILSISVGHARIHGVGLGQGRSTPAANHVIAWSQPRDSASAAAAARSSARVVARPDPSGPISSVAVGAGHSPVPLRLRIALHQP